MRASQILEDQIIHVKRGRQNGFGFEPLWNSYFDFYLDSRYFEHPLLELQDVTFHLFLRKNLNDRNKKWKMPSIRQISKKFEISNNRIYPMFDRLAKAHLLNKDSGVKPGAATERNDYILSDPIPTLEEFLSVAQEGLFRYSLKPEYESLLSLPDEEIEEACSQNENTGVPILQTPSVLEMGTHKQTSFKQTSQKQTIDPRWEKILEDFKFQMNPKTFEMFLGGTNLVSIEEDVAVISIVNVYAKDWIEARLGAKIARSLGLNSIRCEILAE